MATTKPKGGIQAYLVISRLDHDGESFAPGDTVELTQAQAAPLLGQAVAAPRAPQVEPDTTEQ